MTSDDNTPADALAEILDLHAATFHLPPSRVADVIYEFTSVGSIRTTRLTGQLLRAVLADLADTKQRLAAATAVIDRIDRVVPMMPSDSSLIAATSLRAILGTDHLEAYCLDSGHAIRHGAGDRCRAHGASEQPCTGGLRRPRCTHQYGSRNGSGRCDECGRPIEAAAATVQDSALGPT